MPHPIIGPVLNALKDAWAQDPLNTVATAVVPEWETAPWYRRYLRGNNPTSEMLKKGLRV